MAGVEGNGQLELVNTIIGLFQPDAGQILVNGTDITRLPIIQRRRLIAFVPQDRGRMGGSLGASIMENVIMTHHRLDSRFSQWQGLLLNYRFARSFTDDLQGPVLRQHGIEAGSPRLPLRRQPAESGPGPRAPPGEPLCAPGPAHARPGRRIHRVRSPARCSGYASEDRAVLLVSADLEELFLIADRIVVLHRGAVAADLPVRRDHRRAGRLAHAGRPGPGVMSRKAITGAAGIVIALVIGALIMLAQGFHPLSTYQALFQFSLFGVSPLATTIKNSVPLILTGLSASIAFASGPVNLGQPGQLVMGALCATTGGLVLRLPPGLEIPVLVLLAMAGGALWSGLAALLRRAFGMSEFIVTLMLNMIADFFTAWVIAFPLMDPEGVLPHDAADRGERLARRPGRLQRAPSFSCSPRWLSRGSSSGGGRRDTNGGSRARTRFSPGWAAATSTATSWP